MKKLVSFIVIAAILASFATCGANAPDAVSDAAEPAQTDAAQPEKDTGETVAAPADTADTQSAGEKKKYLRFIFLPRTRKEST